MSYALPIKEPRTKKEGLLNFVQIMPIRFTPTDTSASVSFIGATAPKQMEVFMNRKTTRPMIGNPSVEYMNGYFAWQRGQNLDADPYRATDKVSSGRWRRGWAYAEAHRADGPQECVLPVAELPVGPGWEIETGNARVNKWVRA